MIRFLCLWLLEWLWCLSNMIIKPRMIAYKKGFQREIDCGNFNAEAYQYMIRKPFLVKSDYGYSLSCEMIYPKDSRNSTDRSVKETVADTGQKIAILCHGLGYAKYGSVKYVDMFLKRGYHVLIYDHRNHGLSGKAFTSMGYYEKYDLKKLVDWCYEHYGENCKVITHGESMGAATVIMHLGIDDRIQCAIADCAYSDLKEVLCHQLKQFYHLPRFLIPVESLITYLRAGFWYKQVSPIEVVKNTDTPILFIHGKIDNFIPAWMSKQMYEVKRKNKAIYLVAGARHAASYCRDRAGYDRRVGEFLNKYIGL